MGRTLSNQLEMKKLYLFRNDANFDESTEQDLLKYLEEHGSQIYQ